MNICENMPLTYVLLMGAAAGVVVLAFMLVRAGIKGRKGNLQDQLKAIQDSRNFCLVGFLKLIASLDTRKARLQNERVELDTATLQFARLHNAGNESVMHESLCKLTDVFVENYRCINDLAQEVSTQHFCMDTVIASCEQLHLALAIKIIHDEAAGKNSDSTVALAAQLQKEIEYFRRLKRNMEEHYCGTVRFLEKMRQPVYLRESLRESNEISEWIMRRHEKLVARLA